MNSEWVGMDGFPVPETMQEKSSVVMEDTRTTSKPVIDIPARASPLDVEIYDLEPAWSRILSRLKEYLSRKKDK